MHNVSMQACGLPCPSTDAGLTRHAFATIQHVTIDGKNKRTLACAAHSIGREWDGGIDDARAHQIWAVSPPGHVALPLFNSTLAAVKTARGASGPRPEPKSEEFSHLTHL